jgi:hypothetical protein
MNKYIHLFVLTYVHIYMYVYIYIHIYICAYIYAYDDIAEMLLALENPERYRQ